MIDWEKRRKSEEWAKEKACEFCKTNSDLTFAEWCYQKGKEDGAKKIIKFAEDNGWFLCDAGDRDISDKEYDELLEDFIKKEQK